ncbi:hypothetical protein P7C70_g2522, partial [Phenoliferia sp. Uapishka_3]
MARTDPYCFTDASVAASNAPPVSAQPHPDTSLLQTSSASSTDGDESGHSTINLIDSQSAASLRSSIDPDSTQEHEPTSSDFKAARSATAAQVGAFPPSTKPEVGISTEESERIQKAEGWAREKGTEAEEAVRKEVDEVKEVGKKAGKEAAKKARELEKEGREFAKKYPAAASGIVGVANFAVLAAVGAIAYSNWDKPRWDRRTVSAITVGLLGLFGAEGYLGYYEYEKEKST